MENVKRKVFPFLILILSVPCFVPVVLADEIDATTVVDWVIDGDTFDTTSGIGLDWLI